MTSANAFLLVSTIIKIGNDKLTGLNQSFECFLGEVYEFATFLSVEKKNIEEFERNHHVIAPAAQSSNVKKDGQCTEEFKHHYHDSEGTISMVVETMR